MPLATRMREAAAGVSTTIIDTFTRADSTTSLGTCDTGQVWRADDGVCGIGSNQLRPISHGSTRVAASLPLGSSDLDMSITYAVFGGDYGGPAFRVTDAANYFMFLAETPNGKFGLYRRQAGVETNLGFYNVATAAGDVLRVLAVGTSIQCFVNGVLRISATDSFNSTVARAGFATFVSAANSRWDNLSIAPA